ncbi:quinone oxidoreductase-like protein 2 homolog [Ischnura elegans]|uniref:quinone oxidoreductase-like protein 2 homolog n=1 Tax=Ischnura elegans TaxID=197161 RepID=UPI001ED8799D|nr:quinone oxidoreductase-like protein 2 homolog [Ischnura elegans]
MATALRRILSRIPANLITPFPNFGGNGAVRHASFKAAVLQEFKSPLKLEKYSVKKLKKGEVRINIRACGVNALDVDICKGEPNKEIKLPFVPGYEICGEIIEVGSGVKDIAVGDRVVALNKEKCFGFAEQCSVPAQDVFKIPSSIDFKSGAALVETYSTALLGLTRRAELKEGQVILVTAAAGGLGLAVVDVAANVYKAKVIGVCSNEEKAALVRDRGAWAALTYDPKAMLKTVNEVTNCKGVSVVFDTVGGEIFEESLKCAGHESKVVIAGFASHQVPKIIASSLLSTSISLMGVSLAHYRAVNPEVYRNIVLDSIDMCEQGLVKPYISSTVDLEDVNKAIELISERKSTGKVVVKVS